MQQLETSERIGRTDCRRDQLDMVEKRVLVFGAGGFVGRYLVAELKAHGYSVHGSDVVKNENAALYESFSVCDLLDADSVRRLVATVSPAQIVNLAAISSVGLSWKIPQKTMEVNVNGGLNILEAVREECPQARVLFIGSSEEYVVTDQPIREDTLLNANNPYGISKLAIERFSEIYRRRYGMKIFYVRAFNHTGIGQKNTFVIPSWCDQAARISRSGAPGVMKVGNTDVVRDLSDVRDIVRAYRLVLESDDCEVVYNIGSGKGTALSQILFCLQSFSVQPITVEHDPQLFRPADNPVIVCDHSLITERLGWEPEYELKETVKELFEYYVKKTDSTG